MKPLNILVENPLQYNPEFEQQVKKIKDKGGVFIASGQYGSVYQIGNKVKKITTDLDEIVHALLLKGKTTDTFVYIYSVEIINDRLGVITMENMDELTKEITPEFIEKLEIEAQSLGIDPEELDIRPSNFMQHPKTGAIKMVDV